MACSDPPCRAVGTGSRGAPSGVPEGLHTNRYDVDTGRSGGTAYAAVSNTAEGNLMWVQIPPSAPRLASYWHLDESGPGRTLVDIKGRRTRANGPAPWDQS